MQTPQDLQCVVLVAKFCQSCRTLVHACVAPICKQLQALYGTAHQIGWCRPPKTCSVWFLWQSSANPTGLWCMPVLLSCNCTECLDVQAQHHTLVARLFQPLRICFLPKVQQLHQTWLMHVVTCHTAGANLPSFPELLDTASQCRPRPSSPLYCITRTERMLPFISIV